MCAKLYPHISYSSLNGGRTCVCVCVGWAAEGRCVGQGDTGWAAAVAYASTCSSVCIELEGLG